MASRFDTAITQPSSRTSTGGSRFDVVQSRTGTVSTGGSRFDGTSPNLTRTQRPLESSAGLQQLAREQGIDTSNLPKPGEDPNKIFSGGFISDTFDVLNSLQYGVTGLIKGQSFAEGVKSRASFTDKDLIGSDSVGKLVAGIAMDIAVDPLTYIAPWTVFKKIGAVDKAKKGFKTLGKIPNPLRALPDRMQEAMNAKKTIGDQLGYMFVYRYGQDPVYKKIADRAILGREREVQKVVDMVRPLTKLNKETQRAVSAARKAGQLGAKSTPEGLKLTGLTPDVAQKADDIYKELDRLSEAAIEHIPMSGAMKQTYRDNIGSYLRRTFRKVEEGKGKATPFADSKPLRIDKALGIRRKDLPDDVLEALEEIHEAGFPTADAMVRLAKSVETAKFFKQASKFSKEFDDVAEATAEGFKRLPDTATLGHLRNKYVPEFIYDDIQQMIPKSGTFKQIEGPLVGAFKYSKVVLNPATHARNVMSNQILNSFEGLTPGHPVYVKAAREIAKKGPEYQEAQKFGLGVNSFAANELKGFLDSPQLKKAGDTVRDAFTKIGDIYQKEEEWAKMAQYIYQKGKGLSPEDAWKVAERATFNYAQVTPFIRAMRTSLFGMPFITFTYKATPQVVRTALKKPTRISNLGKIKEGVENMGDEEKLAEERATEPQWFKSGYYVRLPDNLAKAIDPSGRSGYLDLTYILPFGDLIGGNIFRRDIDRDTGYPEGIPETVVKRTFLPNIANDLSSNTDFFGNKIYRETDSPQKQMWDIVRYLGNTYAPPLATVGMEGGYREDGTRKESAIGKVLDFQAGGVDQGGAQTRNVMQEALRQVGIKINPVDLNVQSYYTEQNQAQALETLLREQGQLKSFEINYVPQ